MLEADVLAPNCRYKMNSPCTGMSPRPRASGTAYTNVPRRLTAGRFGDWEMDLILDKDSHTILTMVERSSG
nr:hypothetical protein [Segatella maculosa]